MEEEYLKVRDVMCFSFKESLQTFFDKSWSTYNITAANSVVGGYLE